MLLLSLFLLACAPSWPGNGCLRDADCPDTEMCGAGGACLPIAATRVVDAASARCTADADCGSGEVCEVATGLCEAPRCADDAACPDGTRCDDRDGQCRPPVCSWDPDCDTDERCDPSGACVRVTPCQDDAACSAAEVCNIGAGYCMAGDRSSSVYAAPYGAERCDGADNDRDGEVDEAFPSVGTPCEVTEGVCGASGSWRCAADGLRVECDAAPPLVEEERCDGLDNDCDGGVDETFAELGAACVTGVGECARSGVLECGADRLGVVCSAVAGAPTTEACNGLDDDCDGSADEDFPDVGVGCTTGMGACAAAGVVSCLADGSGAACTAVPTAAGTEVCNGVDDDCDGQVDEDLFQACTSACGTGTEWCVAGAWQGCTATQPTAEVCNLVDDNCDGTTDEGCPESWTGGALP